MRKDEDSPLRSLGPPEAAISPRMMVAVVVCAAARRAMRGAEKCILRLLRLIELAMLCVIQWRVVEAV